MKRIIILVLTFYVLGATAQNINPIDEISLGVNYTFPAGNFISRTNGYGIVISENFESSSGFSFGLLNIGRKSKPFQFIYGVEFNYLSSSYSVSYDSLYYKESIWKETFTPQTNLKGNFNSFTLTIPLLCRVNFNNLSKKTPFFIDLGVKYDFITASRTNYNMDYYKYNYNPQIGEYYTKENIQDKSRFYNKRANLGLNTAIGTSFNKISIKISYTHSVFTTYTSATTYTGSGNIRMNYLNFSVNYKLRK